MTTGHCCTDFVCGRTDWPPTASSRRWPSQIFVVMRTDENSIGAVSKLHKKDVESRDSFVELFLYLQRHDNARFSTNQYTAALLSSRLIPRMCSAPLANTMCVPPCNFFRSSVGISTSPFHRMTSTAHRCCVRLTTPQVSS